VSERTQKKEPSKKKPYKNISSSRASSLKPKKEKPPMTDDASGGDDSVSSSVSSKSSSGDVVVRMTNGKELRMDQSAIFKHFLTKPFSTETVCEAIKRIKACTKPINSILHYLEKVCQTVEDEKTRKPKESKKESTVTQTNEERYAIPSPKQPKEKLMTMGERYGLKMKDEK
jgi:hypothetical protein